MNKTAAALAIILAGASGLMAAPLDLQMPGPAEVIGTRREDPARYLLPVGPFTGQGLPTRTLEGVFDQKAYRLDQSRQTTLELIAPLRQQLLGAGFQLLYECATAECGGYDFRYAMDVLPEPQMHVDLGDFRYIAAARAGGDFVDILVSRSVDQGFVQVSQLNAVAAGPEAEGGSGLPQAPVAEVTPVPGPTQEASAAAAAPEAQSPAPQANATTDIGGSLVAEGAAALDDLVFASGKADLEQKDYASLASLAEWLTTHPDRRVVLVGHTDASGGLAGNIALSKQRAQSVRAWLLAHYAVKAAQIDAQGAGYLAPRASNETDEGRRKNRRVEAILTPTL